MIKKMRLALAGTASIKQWIREQNVYAWALGIGILGMVDALSPGSRDVRIIGSLIVLVAAYIWILQ